MLATGLTNAIPSFTMLFSSHHFRASLKMAIYRSSHLHYSEPHMQFLHCVPVLILANWTKLFYRVCRIYVPGTLRVASAPGHVSLIPAKGLLRVSWQMEGRRPMVSSPCRINHSMMKANWNCPQRSNTHTNLQKQCHTASVMKLAHEPSSITYHSSFSRHLGQC